MSGMEQLGKELLISEERKQALDLACKRLTVEHSLTLYRGKSSVSDFRAMLAYLEAEGMPETATLDVRADCQMGSLRLWATWSTEPKGES